METFYLGLCTTLGEAYVPSIRVQCTRCPHEVWVSAKMLELASQLKVICTCCTVKVKPTGVEVPEEAKDEAKEYLASEFFRRGPYR